MLSRSRGSAACCMLLLALAASFCLSYGAETPVKPQQEGYGYGAYDSNDQGPYGGDAEGPSYGHGENAYEGYQDKSEYGGGSYDKSVLMPICLQTTSAPDMGLTHYFSCCQKTDAADYCVNNSTYPDYGEDTYEHKEKDSFLDTMVNPDIAAVCRFEASAETCPEFLGETCSSIWITNCTLMKHACGLAIDDAVTLTAKLYQTEVSAVECLPLSKVVMKKRLAGGARQGAGPMGQAAAADQAEVLSMRRSNSASTAGALPYKVTAERFQGAITYGATSYGPVEVKGTLEGFGESWLVRDANNEPQVMTDFTDVQFIKAHQLIIRLLQPSYE